MHKAPGLFDSSRIAEIVGNNPDWRALKIVRKRTYRVVPEIR